MEKKKPSSLTTELDRKKEEEGAETLALLILSFPNQSVFIWVKFRNGRNAWKPVYSGAQEMLIPVTDAACLESALTNPGRFLWRFCCKQGSKQKMYQNFKTPHFSCDLMIFICMCYCFS